MLEHMSKHPPFKRRLPMLLINPNNKIKLTHKLDRRYTARDLWEISQDNEIYLAADISFPSKMRQAVLGYIFSLE